MIDLSIPHNLDLYRQKSWNGLFERSMARANIIRLVKDIGISWENMRQLLSDMRAKFSAGVGPSAFCSAQKDEAIFELLEMIEVNEGRNPSQKKKSHSIQKTAPKSKMGFVPKPSRQVTLMYQRSLFPALMA